MREIYELHNREDLELLYFFALSCYFSHSLHLSIIQNILTMYLMNMSE